MKKLSVSGNVVFGFLGWALPLGISFVLTPVIVRSLGVEAYGLFGLVITFTGYFATLNFNVGRSVIRLIAAQDSRSQVRRISEVISSASLLYLLVGFASAAVLAGAAKWLVISVLGITPELRGTAILALRIAAVGLIFTMVSQVLMAVAQGLQRFDVSTYLSVASGGGQILGNGILAYCGYGVTSLVMWNLVVSILSFGGYLGTVRFLLPGFKLLWSADKSVLRSLLKFGGAVTAYQVCSSLIVLFERGWINRSLGTAAVGYYIVPMTVATYLHSMISSMSLVLFPMASEAESRGDRKLLHSIYTRAIKLIWVVVVFFGITLCLGSRQFMVNWMGNDFAVRTAVLLAIQVAVFSLIAMIIVPWQIADGIGFPGINAILCLFWLVCTSVLGIILTGKIGLCGFAWARLAGMVVLPLYVFWVERRAFGKCLAGFWVSIIWRLLLAGAGTAAAEIALFYFLPVGWAGFIICSLLGGALFAAIVWGVGYLEADERKWILGLASRFSGSIGGMK
jgi:O-antigen/teichoic acid export membrane protein